MTLIIHPGFHKTATTWLQEDVFSNSRYFNRLLSHEEINSLLVAPHDLAFDPAAFDAAMQQKMQRGASGTAQILSSEIMSGNILLGSRDSATVARRLASAVKDAKILFTVRSQKSITKSIYIQYLKRGGRLPLDEFLTYTPPPGYFWFDPVTLEFDRLVSIYAEEYGAENILVLPQELLRGRKEEYLRLIFEFADMGAFPGVSEVEYAGKRGVSPRAAGLPLIRFANKLRRSTFNPAPRTASENLGRVAQALGYRWRVNNETAEARLKAIVDEHLTHRYGASNRRLQKYAPVDLSDLGYEMEP